MRSLVIYLLFFCAPLVGQNILVKGIVTDNETKKPLPYVAITSSPMGYFATTDSAGAFQLLIDENTGFLVFNLLGYAKKTYAIPSILSNPLQIRIGLKSKATVLPDVTVFGSPVAPVIKNKSFYVRDYDVLEDGKILALIYEINQKGGQVILTDENGKTFSKALLPDEPVELFLDCYGNHHAVTEGGAYQIYLEEDTIVKLLDMTGLERFRQFLVPCVGQSSGGLFFLKKYTEMRSLPLGQPKASTLALSYMMVTNEKERKYLCTINDEKMAKLQKDEDYFEASQKKAGMYRPGPFGTEGHGAERDRMFLEMTMVKDAYAPLVIKKDSVLIFNFTDSKIEFYSALGSYLKANDMKFERNKFWKRQLIYDKPQGKFYTVFDNGGVLSVRQIDPYTGTITRVVKLGIPFGSKIKIVNDVVYFIKSDAEWDGTKYLYRQRLD